MFYLLVTDFLTPSEIASLIASARYGYSQIPYARLRGCFPVILRMTLCWKPSSARSILGEITHVSALNSNTS